MARALLHPGKSTHSTPMSDLPLEPTEAELHKNIGQVEEDCETHIPSNLHSPSIALCSTCPHSCPFIEDLQLLPGARMLKECSALFTFLFYKRRFSFSPHTHTHMHKQSRPAPRECILKPQGTIQFLSGTSALRNLFL